MTDINDMQKSDLTGLLTNAAGYRRSHILLTAISFDVFTTIETLQKPTAQKLAEALGFNFRGVEKFLGGLIALDLVSFDGTYYHNKQTARIYLVRTSPFYMGEGIRTLFDIGQDTWSSLTKTLELGKPIAVQRTDAAEAEFWPKLTNAIRPFNIPVADSAANLLLWKKEKITKVLDLGGGSGAFGKAFLKVFPKAKVIQVDWPSVNAEARKFNAESVKDGRFKTIDGDLFETPWEQEGAFDVVILSHIIHQEDTDRVKTLLRRIGNSTHENSEIIINEFAVNEKKNYPPYSLIFGLSMVLQNHNGGVYSYSDFNEMLSVINHEVYMTVSPFPPSTLFFSCNNALKAKARNISTVTGDSVKKKTDDLPMPNSFLSRQWDTAPRKNVETWLFERFKEQVQFAVANSVYWKKRIPESFLKSEFTRETIEKIPVIFKSELRLLSPFDLSAEKHVWHLMRGSGGTTGVPVSMLWTLRDWNASIETAVRFLKDVRDWKYMRIWNGYNQAHVSGPAFDDMARMLGATPIPRHFKVSEEEAIKEMEHLKINAMVLTPKSGSGKGGSLEDFLGRDPDFITRLGIKNLWVSSTNLDRSLVKELRSLGVESITNLYGSTEGLPTGISCNVDPEFFHICYGHIFLEVLDESGKHVQSGKRGMVVVSRIGSSKDHKIGPCEGTQVLRYVVGDSAIYHDEPCSCGLSSPRISHVERVAMVEEKVLGGCERWD